MTSAISSSPTGDSESTVAAEDGFGSGGESRASHGPLEVGAVIANEYVVVRQIGSGGMGVVYLAHHVELAREVAIKLRTTAGGPAAQRRMLREAQAMARLSHPNVLTVYDVGEHHDAIFIAMEYVPGGTLRQWLSTRQRTWREIVRVFRDAGHGLIAAHAAGLIHRDFKPDNVLVGDQGRPRVADFGIARSAPGTRRDLEVSPQSAALAPHVAAFTGSTSITDGAAPTREQLQATTDLTQSGVFSGTPAYMAPEQYGTTDIDERADQFSFCVAMWEALYGARPFQGSTAAAVYAAICAGQIHIPRRVARRRRVPRWLHQLLLRGLSLDPSQRWPSLQTLVAELEAQPRRQTTIALALGSVLGLAGVAWLAYAMGVANDPSADGTDELERVRPSTEPGTSDGPELQDIPQSVNARDQPATLAGGDRPSSPPTTVLAPPMVAPTVERLEPAAIETAKTLTCAGPLHLHDVTLAVEKDEAIWAVNGCDLLVERVTFRGHAGINAGGNAKVVVLDSTFETAADGLWIGGNAHVTIARSTITSAAQEGISIGGEAVLDLLDTKVTAATALYIAGKAQARVVGGQFTGSTNSVSFVGKAFAQRDAVWVGPVYGDPARVMPASELILVPEPSSPPKR